MNSLKHFIKCIEGSIPLIISVPHGGTKKRIKKTPIRSGGVLGTDKKTIKLAQELIMRIKELYKSNLSIKEEPSLIFSRVHRSKIDINRKEEEAFDNRSQLARKIYQFYHNKLKELIKSNLTKFNYSLLVDIHGFEKKDTPKGYRNVELILGTNNLKTFFSEIKPKKEWDKNLRGKIIKKFLELGVPIAPGHQRRREYALTGGFITQNYGASNIKNSQTIQIEFSDKVRLHNKELRKKVIYALAEIIYEEYLRKT